MKKMKQQVMVVKTQPDKAVQEALQLYHIPADKVAWSKVVKIDTSACMVRIGLK